MSTAKACSGNNPLPPAGAAHQPGVPGMGSSLEVQVLREP